MPGYFRSAILIAVAIAIAGCGSAGGSGGTSVPSNTVGPGAGTFAGTWSSNVAMTTDSLTLDLTQTGNAISGTATLTNACFSAAAFSGILNGSSFTGTLSASGGENELTLTATLNGNQITGTYQTKLFQPPCTDDNGSFSLMRQ